MGKMSDEIRKQRLAELFGLEAPPEPKPEDTVAKESRSREAEAVLLYVENPKGFTRVLCKRCRQSFAVNRGSIRYCSDTCRAEALNDIGIVWDFNRHPADRWRTGRAGPEPLLVPPPALEVLDSWDLLLTQGPQPQPAEQE